MKTEETTSASEDVKTEDIRSLEGYLYIQEYCGDRYCLGKLETQETALDVSIDSLFEGLKGKRVKVTVEEIIDSEEASE